MRVFGKSKALIAKIENYLRVIQKAGLIFSEAIKDYMNGEMELFEDRVSESKKVELDADQLRRDIKHKLYAYLLIPESRGDVLALLETLDDVPDIAHKVLKNFSIESPIVPESLHKEFISMGEYTEKGIDSLVHACSAYFSNISAVNDHINKVFFYEYEVDKVEERIKRAAFQIEEIELFSRRVHVRYFAEKIALLSDATEQICERLSVFVIKREI